MLDALPLDESAVNRAFASASVTPSLFRRPCAREVAALAEEARAAAAQQSGAGPAAAADRAPDSSPTSQTSCSPRPPCSGRWNAAAEAAEVLERAEALVAGRPSLEAQVALARADLAWSRRRPPAAGACCSRPPALRPGRDLEREAEVKRVASPTRACVRCCTPSSTQAPTSCGCGRWSARREVAPEDGVVNYLLGRRLLAARASPARRAMHSGRALADSAPRAGQPRGLAAASCLPTTGPGTAPRCDPTSAGCRICPRRCGPR